jgi:protein-L-isoaspartate(D-aspartate) O-methyltransferase
MADGVNGDPSDEARQRLAMVEAQIVGRGIRQKDVVAAMRAVPRHLFVPEAMRRNAYADSALSIGYNQTISQPYMVALMTELLELTVRSRVLEVGTGSGYQTAVLAELAGEVYSIERVPELAARAREALAGLGYHNVQLFTGDGSVGLPDSAPFDAILVTAAAPQAPPPLLAQLTDGGRLVIPLGPVNRDQKLTLIVRHGDAWTELAELGCRFVPLLGAEGFGGVSGEHAEEDR